MDDRTSPLYSNSPDHPQDLPQDRFSSLQELLVAISRMPLSYRCDYCGRAFEYTRENVRKHNLSKQHLKLKEDYYKQFESEAVDGKGWCSKFKTLPIKTLQFRTLECVLTVSTIFETNCFDKIVVRLF